MWNWTFPGANLTLYKRFVDNVNVTNYANFDNSNYTRSIPRIFKCPDSDNCLNDNDNIIGNCAVGYTGWLCTNCVPCYYLVLTSCVPCPSLAILILECSVFFMLCTMISFMFCWHVKRKDEKKNQVRSFFDVIIARIKILLGFYQVIGEILTCLNDINWTGPLVIIGRFISAFEVNFLKLFVRPRCFDVNFDLNLKLQFIVASIAPVLIALVPFICYHVRKLYVRIRYSSVVYGSFHSQFQKLKSSLWACVVVLWFVIYPPVCSVIFSMYPMSCKSFPLDQNYTYNITRLRSDFDMDCTELRAYHIAAFILTAIYVILFPVALLYNLQKSDLLSSKNRSESDDFHSDNTADSNSSFVTNDSPILPSPSWLNFFCENYKKNFWFWEIVELARKITQTLLITLFGWESRLTVILTTCISVLFLLLHARYRPMKNSYEHGLQVITIYVFLLLHWQEILHAFLSAATAQKKILRYTKTYIYLGERV